MTTFEELYPVVAPHTMLSEARLQSLYTLAVDACRGSGNFVECGVCAGGSSALLAKVITQYSSVPRRLFACDSFTGLPKPTWRDRRQGVNACDIKIAGNCSAPLSELAKVCAAVGVSSVVTPVKGWFKDTLPVWKRRMTPICMLHMDADWYASTMCILENLYDALMPGAYVQVDDYCYWHGCQEAIIQFQENQSVTFDLQPIDESGVWFRKPQQ